eukprot:symbB.v1.2.002611.t1/scaffold135.1/size305288/31
MDELFQAQLPCLAQLLGPVQLWRLRPLKQQVALALSPSILTYLRSLWALDGSKTEEPLCQVLRERSTSSTPLLVGERLLRYGTKVLMPDELGQSALTWATEYGLEEILQLLIRASPDVQQVERNGWYPLIRAAWSGRLHCSRLLLAAKADVEGPAGSGSRYSPLMCAARWGHLEVVKVLLEASADTNRRNRFGEDAMMLAKGQGHWEVWRLLQAGSGETEPASGERKEEEWRTSTNARRTLGHGWIALGRDFYLDKDLG